MENATKALLIAGAVLLVIMIISVGLMIFNSANGQITGAISQMNQQEKDQFNSRFSSYEGNQVSGSTVKTLFQTVKNHNIQMLNENTPEKYVNIQLLDAAGKGETVAKTTQASKVTKAYNHIDSEAKFEKYANAVVSGAKYTVKVFQNTTTGLIDKIYIGRN